MDFWARRAITLRGSDSTFSIFDAIAQLALRGTSSSESFTKAASAAATGTTNPAMPDPVAATAAAGSNPAVEESKPKGLAGLLTGITPSYRRGATGAVHAVYDLPREYAERILRQAIPDPKERFAVASNPQGTVIEYEDPDDPDNGTTYQIYFRPDGKAQVARVLRDEEYEGLDPRKVRAASVSVTQAGRGGMPQFGGGDPFLMLLPMMYQMMMMSDPGYAQMAQMRAMMWQQMMMRQMMMAQMMQQMKGGANPFG
jgi:hypothetical protein